MLLLLHLKSDGPDGTFMLKEGNVLFNDTLNTFCLWLYGVEHMVKDHSDSERKPAAATWATLFNQQQGNVLFNDTLNTLMTMSYDIVTKFPRQIPWQLWICISATVEGLDYLNYNEKHITSGAFRLILYNKCHINLWPG